MWDAALFAMFGFHVGAFVITDACLLGRVITLYRRSLLCMDLVLIYININICIDAGSPQDEVVAMLSH